MITFDEAVKERFWDKVSEGVQDACWFWTGAINNHGYGSFRLNGKTQLAHRVAWMMTHGIHIPEGLVVMHMCDEPKCCNPNHLALGTVNDNNQDAIRKGRARHARGSEHGRARLTEAAISLMCKMYRSGEFTKHDLGYIFGVSAKTVDGILRGNSWTWLRCYDAPNARLYRNRGALHHNAKVTEEIVRNLRSEHASGVKQVALAQKYGLTESRVSKIVRNESWAWVR